MDDLEQFAAEAAQVDQTAGVSPEQPAAGAGEAATPEQEAVLITPEEEAAQLLGMLAFALKSFWPVLEYREETINEGAKRLAPLLVKYDMRSELLGRWGAEIEAGMFFGGVAYASYLAVINTPKQEAKPEGVAWWKRPFKWFKS